MNKRILIGLEPGIREAVDALVSIVSTETFRWCARLYDPTVGGFYFSNSARDYEGFLPDLESTVQILRRLKHNGMTSHVDGDLTRALPAEMQKKIIEFVNGCQDRDGEKKAALPLAGDRKRA